LAVSRFYRVGLSAISATQDAGAIPYGGKFCLTLVKASRSSSFIPYLHAAASLHFKRPGAAATLCRLRCRQHPDFLPPLLTVF